MAWVVENDEYPKQDTWGNLISVFTMPYPKGIFTTSDSTEYPHWDGQTMMNVLSEPYPEGVFMTGTDKNNGYPTYMGQVQVDIFTEPYPDGVFVTENNNYPKYRGQHPITMGAFNRSTLEDVKVAKSVKSLGELSFAESLIKQITINPECTYFDTTFPEGCEVITS